MTFQKASEQPTTAQSTTNLLSLFAENRRLMHEREALEKKIKETLLKQNNASSESSSSLIKP